MNRQTRRHPTHPMLHVLDSSKRRILDSKRKKPCSIPKGVRKRIRMM